MEILVLGANVAEDFRVLQHLGPLGNFAPYIWLPQSKNWLFNYWNFSPVSSLEEDYKRGDFMRRIFGESRCYASSRPFKSTEWDFSGTA